MTPKTVAAALRQIASKIDASENPQRQLVARDLKLLLTRIAEASLVEQEQHAPVGQQQTVTQEQQAMPQSGVGKKMLAEALQAAQDALAKGDENALKKAVENVQKAHK